MARCRIVVRSGSDEQLDVRHSSTNVMDQELSRLLLLHAGLSSRYLGITVLNLKILSKPGLTVLGYSSIQWK